MNTESKIVDHFLNNNTPKQLGNYATNGQVLIYVVPEKRTKEVLAVKFNDLIVGNSSGLDHAPKVNDTSRANRRQSTGEALVQQALNDKVLMVPFQVFKQANLDLSKFELIERGASETVIKFEYKNEYDKKTDNWIEVKTEVSQHYTGASLFKVDGQVFLFDLDRNELVNGILNPFLVKLSDSSVKTIKDAYESLKPDLVKDAEKAGLKVERQGEWFFIPADIPKNVIQVNFKPTKQRSGNETTRMILRAGPNRPNYAEKGFTMNETNYVSGLIEHSGREHKDLELKDWYIAVPNTATTSWTITGDID